MRNGHYRLSGDYQFSALAHPLQAGITVREISFVPADPTLPDVSICTVYSSRNDAQIILDALTRQVTP